MDNYSAYYLVDSDMNRKLLDKFLYWIDERQKIYLLKESDAPWPWTDDPILQQYKFTNVFREQDAMTKLLRRRVSSTDPQWKQFWKIYAFRMFNLHTTYDRLLEAGLIQNWNAKKAIKLLSKASLEGNKIFTGAYIITNAGSTQPKINVICNALTPAWQDKKVISGWIRKSMSIQNTVSLLTKFPNVGKFVAYEIATDLRHTPLLWGAGDIHTWANPGPGARRGLNRLHDRPIKTRPPENQMVEEMRELQDLVNQARLPNLHKQKVEMRDIEHSLCEFDKYMRVLNDEGRPRSKYNAPKIHT